MTDTMTAPLESVLAPPPDLGPGPVVVAVGGVDPTSVLRAARMLEPRVGGGILAVSVLEPPSASILGAEPRFLPPHYLDQQRAELATRLAEHLRTAGGAATGWHTRVVDGEPAFALTDLAASVQSPLLVMGIGRHRMLDRVFGSETTLRAIRLASCPVLAVHPDLDGPFHDVVVAVDFSPASAYAAQLALPDVAQDDMRIGDGRLQAAAPEGGRPRIRPCASGSHAQRAAIVDPSDAPAPCRHGFDEHTGQRDRHAGHLAAAFHQRRAVEDQADVGAGAPDVDRERLLESRETRDQRRAHHAARRAGERKGRGMARRFRRRQHAA